MKRFLMLTATGLMFAAATALAVPRGAETTGPYHLFAAQDLSAWHVGGTYRRLKRSVDISGGQRSLKLNRAAFYAGFGVLPWVTVFGTVGSVEADLSGFHGDSHSGTTFGGGAWFNLLDHDLIDNLALENRLRVQGVAQWSYGDPKVGSASIKYNEVHAALTLTLINEIDGNKQFWPEAVSLFVGPAFNTLDSSRFDSRTSEFGLVVGSDVLISRRVNLSVRFENYGSSDEAVSASLNIRL